MKKFAFLVLVCFLFSPVMVLSAEDKIVVITPNAEQNKGSAWETVDLTTSAPDIKDQSTDDSDFIIVGLVEGEIGYNRIWNQVQDSTQSGVWTDGKLVLYAKGKILGKYLIELSYDSNREYSQLFQDISPEEYYPVLGDGSTLKNNVKTNNKLYVAVRSDEIDFVYGKYKVELKKTRYINFDSELSGFRIAYHDENFNQEETGISAVRAEYFQADSTQTFSEDYLLSTGGYLYFLSKKNIRPNSVNVYIEVRNTQTGGLSSRYALNKEDYQIDHADGRIALNVPIASILYNRHGYNTLDNFSDTVYLWATYESYENTASAQSQFSGGRGELVLSDDIQLGGTYVEKTLNGQDTHMMGIDGRIKTDNTDVYVEYANSNFSNSVNLSSDGGLSYKNTNLNSTNQEKTAIYLKGKGSYLDNRLNIDVLAANESFGFTTFNGANIQSEGKIVVDGDLSYRGDDFLAGYSVQSQHAFEGATQSIIDKIGGYSKRVHRFYGGANVVEGVDLEFLYDFEEVAASTTYIHTLATQRFTGGTKIALNDYANLSLAVQTTTPDARTTTNTVDPTTSLVISGKLEALLDENLAADFSASYDKDKATTTYTGGLTYYHEDIEVRLSAEKSAGNSVKQSVGLKYQLDPHLNIHADKQLGESGGYSSGVSYRPNQRFEVGLDVDQSENNQRQVSVNTNYKNDELTLKGNITSATNTVVGGDVVYEADDIMIIKGGIRADSHLNNQRYLGVTAQDEDLALSANTKFDQSGTNNSQISANYRKNDQQSYGVSYNQESQTSGTKTDTTVLTNRYHLNNGVSLENSLIHKDYGNNKTRKQQAYQLSQLFPSGSSYGFTVSSYEEFIEQQKNGQGWSTQFLANRHNGQSFSANVESGSLVNLDNQVVKRFLVKFNYAHTTDKDLPAEFSKFSHYLKWNYRTDQTGASQTIQHALKAGLNHNVSRDLVVHIGVDYSKNDNQSTTLENYRKYTIGAAYRPVDNDEVNLVGLFRWIQQNKPRQTNEVFDHYYEGYVIALEAAWQISQNAELYEKIAYRYHKEKAFNDSTFNAENNYWLWGNRVKFQIQQDIDLSLEYTLRKQSAVNESDHGLGFYFDKRLEQIVLSAGYKYNQFDTNLTNLSEKTSGPYFRISGLLSESGW